MKIILPTLREKKRYLAFDVVSEEAFKTSEIKNAIKKESLKFLGEMEFGRAGIMMIGNTGKQGIIRVNNKYVNNLKTSLMLVKDVNNKKLTIKTTKVSGILKKLKEAR